MGKKHKGNNWSGEEDGSSNRRQYDVSQEDLSEYIRVGRPGLIVVIASLLIMLVAVFIWGFAGTLPVTETVTGLVVDTSGYAKMYPEEVKAMADGKEGGIMVLCFVDASRFNGQAIKEFGDGAVLKMPDQTTYKGTIEIRYMEPISREKARKLLFDNEWVLDKCAKQDYNWLLIIRPEEDLSKYDFTLSEVTLLTEEVPPIRFLMQ